MTDTDDSIERATDPARQAALARALQNAAVYGGAGPVETIETHISHLFLAGPWVYKIKKAVDLGFLDFRTLSARHFYCREELRLNRRFAPQLYREVVPIAGSVSEPVLGGSGEPIEWAVKMRRFPQEDRLDRRLAEHRLSVDMIDELAKTLADFHVRIAAATDTDNFGTPCTVRRPMQENFLQVGPLLQSPADIDDLDLLREWTLRALGHAQEAIVERKRGGFVRECHGDLHLANIALVDGRVTLFDCLEFNADLRWTDVMSDVAFLTMDLQSKDRDDLAQRFLNAYLEHTGDYAGLCVLDLYRVYRALVRAKVACLGLTQTAPEHRDRRAALLDEYHRYIARAKSLTQRPTPVLMIAHGFSGSGKTTLSQTLLEMIGAVRIRSDVERKRLSGLPALARTQSALGQGLYTRDASARTYTHLLNLAQNILAAGYSVFVDATFLRREQRDAFRRVAQALHVPFWIIDFSAEPELLRARIRQRERRARDASEAGLAVFESQLADHDPLANEELCCVFSCDAGELAAARNAPVFWVPLMQRLSDPPR